MTQYFLSFIIVNLDIRRYRMDHNKYMTTGEFARRMGVTKIPCFIMIISVYFYRKLWIPTITAIIPFTRWKYLTQLSF